VKVGETTPMVSRGRTLHTIALDQSALLEVLEALKGGDIEERVRQAATTIYQALIEAEPSAVIGAQSHERTPDRVARETGIGPRRSRPRPVTWN
jgi:hypothetical protein